MYSFGNVTLKDILSGVVLEGADLDTLFRADVHDTTDSTGKVNESVPEKKVVVSDDDDDDDDDNCNILLDYHILIRVCA